MTFNVFSQQLSPWEEKGENFGIIQQFHSTHSKLRTSTVEILRKQSILPSDHDKCKRSKTYTNFRSKKTPINLICLPAQRPAPQNAEAKSLKNVAVCNPCATNTKINRVYTLNFFRSPKKKKLSLQPSSLTQPFFYARKSAWTHSSKAKY